MKAACRSALLALTLSMPLAARAEPERTVLVVDAAASHHPISPLIYGVNFATRDQLADLNAPVNRSGGNSASLYNWAIDARNTGKDWFFESLPCGTDIMDQHGTNFVALSKEGGAEPMLTIPAIGWVAKLDENRKPLPSFSIGKYGLQQDFDENGLTSAGNGLTLDGAPITNNDPNDAAQPDDPAQERKWIESLVGRWGSSSQGGVRYYIVDNEPSYWHEAHRDVHPVGAHAKEIAQKVIAVASMVKSVDPGALVVAPEEWGWTGYHYSGFDQQYAATHTLADAPDRHDQTRGMDYLPWLLTQWKAAGHPVDVVSVHYYPQGGEYSETKQNTSPAMQLTRNRSTRDLWDTHYRNPTWINDTVALIPTLRKWVDTYYYPGTPIAITEYNWGAENSMNGATAQADILGIFGREGLDIATRWATPATGSPVYLAMKLYRNYDGRHSGFGETSISARAPDADQVAAFAALRADGALTVMAINKRLDQTAPIALTLAHYADHGRVESYQLAGGKLNALPAQSYSGSINATLPAQSVTLFVLHGTD
jgi:hypothetical protein